MAPPPETLWLARHLRREQHLRAEDDHLGRTARQPSLPQDRVPQQRPGPKILDLPLSDPKRFYVQPLEPGDYMRALGIGKVIESRSDTLRVDTLVLARTGWSELSIHDASTLTPLKAPNGLHETHFMGALGLPGFTAYYALSEILKLQKSDFVVVSAAAGAVGSMVVQIAKKVLGCAKVLSILKCVLIDLK